MYIIKCKSISNIVLYKEWIVFYRKITICTNYNSNLTEIRAAVLSSTTGLHKFMFGDDQIKHFYEVPQHPTTKSQILLSIKIRSSKHNDVLTGNQTG